MKTLSPPPVLEITANGDRPGKVAKNDKKARRQRQQSMSAREQCRNLWEAVNQARRMVELADHKARYALVVMGVVNAGVFLLATRSEHFIQLVPEGSRPLLSFLIIPFGLISLLFLVDAYNSLRPRPPIFVADGPYTNPEDRPKGLIFWDTLLAGSLDRYQHSWQTVHLGQFNNELAAMAYSLAHGIRAKYAALHRLYIELLLIILLAGFILAVPLYFGFLSNGSALIQAP
jgi:hypothetical protein